jgi:hypothetical protein
MIKKEGDKFNVYDSSGKKRLGSHSSRKSALKQLAAIEISKKNKYADGGVKERLQCNKPTRSNREGKKKMVKACKDGKEKLIHYGAKGYKHNYSKEAKKSFRARHGCDSANDKMSARYWACKNLWGKSKKIGEK